MHMGKDAIARTKVKVGQNDVSNAHKRFSNKGSTAADAGFCFPVSEGLRPSATMVCPFRAERMALRSISTCYI